MFTAKTSRYEAARANRARANSMDSTSTSSSWYIPSEHESAKSLVEYSDRRTYADDLMEGSFSPTFRLRRSFSFQGSSGLRSRYLTSMKPHLYRHPQDSWEVESLNFKMLSSHQKKTLWCIWMAKISYYFSIGMLPVVLPSIVGYLGVRAQSENWASQRTIICYLFFCVARIKRIHIISYRHRFCDMGAYHSLILATVADGGINYAASKLILQYPFWTILILWWFILKNFLFAGAEAWNEEHFQFGAVLDWNFVYSVRVSDFTAGFLTTVVHVATFKVIDDVYTYRSLHYEQDNLRFIILASVSRAIEGVGFAGTSTVITEDMEKYEIQ